MNATSAEYFEPHHAKPRGDVLYDLGIFWQPLCRLHDSGSDCPESWQAVRKWLFERGSVKQKKWKSPHKYWGFLAGLGGLEPSTSPLSGAFMVLYA
jgi:hypothetical protein